RRPPRGREEFHGKTCRPVVSKALAGQRVGRRTGAAFALHQECTAKVLLDRGGLRGIDPVNRKNWRTVLRVDDSPMRELLPFQVRIGTLNSETLRFPRLCRAISTCAPALSCRQPSLLAMAGI